MAAAAVALALLLAGSPEPVVLVTAPPALSAIGLELGDVLGAPGKGRRSNAELLAEPAYASLVEAIEKDLREIARDDRTLKPGMGSAHRLFDARFLRAKSAWFELIAVSNRLDRRPFHPAACGEVRLVYRLAYSDPKARSRLPMTINVVFWVLDECRAAASRWMLPALSPAELGARLRSGALSAEALDLARLKSVEVNLQSVRWPSTVRPDLAGHAEYLLRAFQRDPATRLLSPMLLENTPDVARVSRSAALRRELVALIRDPKSLDALDRGVFLLPDAFLATRAISVAPHSQGRRANQLFTQLLSAPDLAELPLEGRRTIASPAALLRRLDDLACVGCHQGRSIAGFHLVGQDPADTIAGNSIAVAASPHLVRDLPRRARFTAALASAGSADESRPLSERADEGEGDHGSHCGLGDPGFARWTCREGLTCKPVNVVSGAAVVGECFASAAPAIGEPCMFGAISPSAHPHKDRVASAPELACARDGVCEASRVGFPGGMCAQECEGIGEDGTCGVIAILQGFNDCLGRNRPFGECIAENVRPAGLRRCDDLHPCRDDYVCGRTPSGQTPLSAQQVRLRRSGGDPNPPSGACLPPYFLFQLRVDGHPKPR